MADPFRDATAAVEAGAPRLRALGEGHVHAGAGAPTGPPGVGDLIEQAPLAIAVLRGRDHVYELANAPYLELVGRTASLVGIPIRAAFPDVEGQGVIEACDRVFATGEPFTVHEMAVTFQRRKGAPEKRWFSFHISPIREAGAAGRIEGLIWVAADIT
jgi:PAS domain-containing protein